MNAEREQFVRENAVALVNELEAKVKRQSAELTRVNQSCTDLRAENEQIRAEIETLQEVIEGNAESLLMGLLACRRVRELEAALKPFAEYDYADAELKHLPQPERDAERIGYGHNSPTYGDCRRAAELLAAKGV